MSQNDRGNQGRSEEDADDVRLMQLVGRGDTRAFEQLIEKHQTLVAGTVARMLGSSSDVEDIAQQVFIRFGKVRADMFPRAKFTTWLLKITRNLVFNEMRRTKRRPHVPLQSEPGVEDPPLKDETNLAPDASLLESELQQAIEEAIQRLPETPANGARAAQVSTAQLRTNRRGPRSLRAGCKKRALSRAHRAPFPAQQISDECDVDNPKLR
jgi:RNA polymerase sigma factor (sigma-70 family)